MEELHNFSNKLHVSHILPECCYDETRGFGREQALCGAGIYAFMPCMNNSVHLFVSYWKRLKRQINFI